MASIIHAYFANIETYGEDSDQTPAPTEVSTLRAFLLNESLVEETARALSRRTERSTSFDTMRIRKSMLWYFINKTAVDLPLAQSRLVTLLQTIRTLKPTTVPISTGFYTDDIWSKLEGWTNKWADSINNYECAVFPSGEDQEGIDSSIWPSVTAFSARLMATNDPVLADLFFIRRSATSIIRALDIDQAVKTDVLAASQLFVLSSGKLFERCQAGDSVEGLDVKDVVGTMLWKYDLRKLSVERWEHWKIRWQSIAEHASDECKTAAAASLQAMKSID